MWGWKLNGRIWLILLFLSGFIQAQNKYAGKYDLPPAGSLVKTYYSLSYTQKIEYTVSFSIFSYANRAHDGSFNNIVLFQAAKYTWQTESRKKIRFTNQIVHNLGLQVFPDSLAKINVDDNTVTSRLEIPIGIPIKFCLTSIITSRLLKGYDYIANDSGQLRKRLSSSFLSPLVCNLSGGFSFNPASAGSLILGFSGVKITWMRDHAIYREQEAEILYGVREAKGCLIEYGISLQYIFDRDISDRFHWNCDFLLFKNWQTPWDVNMKNQLGMKIGKLMKVSLQTRILYETQISQKLQFENILCLALMLNAVN